MRRAKDLAAFPEEKAWEVAQEGQPGRWPRREVVPYEPTEVLGSLHRRMYTAHVNTALAIHARDVPREVQL